MIYKSFFKRKVTKIYLFIFLIFSIVLSFLILAKNFLVVKGNEAYKNSFIYFMTDKEIDLADDKNVKAYNKGILLDCNNQLTSVFVVSDKPIIEIDEKEAAEFGYKECVINEYSVKYIRAYHINIVENKRLFDDLDKEQKEYYYFVSLNNWFEGSETVEELTNKYKVEVFVSENKIDDNNYKDVIYIFTLFIKIIVILFIILFVVSIINIIVDEKKNNNLYYALGYAKLRIISITINKILLIIFIPLIIILLSFIIGFIVL